MKKLLLIALLVGCGGNVPQATTTPDPAEQVVQDEENSYIGVLDALYGIVEMNVETFAAFCTEINGIFNISDEFSTCLGTDGSGFALRTANGVSVGAALLVPAEHGQDLADAVVEAVGSPEVYEGAAVWDLTEHSLVMAPLPNGMWLLVLEKAGTSL